jgi:hypothetical protein
MITIGRVVPCTPSHETILRHFRTCRGLYILGAGASAGLVPFGPEFLRGPGIDYVRGGGFPADLPQQSELTRRSVAAFTGMDVDDRRALFFPGRDIRPGTTDFPVTEFLLRQPDFFTRQRLKHALAESRFRHRQSDSYLVFRLFHPSVILNYNLDGLASDLCGQCHRVIAAHHTVERRYGSPEMAQFLASVREFDLPVPSDDILLCAPESYTDFQLLRRLSEAMRSPPHFVALIGYSFGRNGSGYDDRVSWDFFCRAFDRFAGNIYVVEPKPDDLQGRIAQATKSKNVFGVRAYWNILAHAFIEASGDRPSRKSLNYACEQILDTSGDRVIFPRYGVCPISLTFHGATSAAACRLPR